MRNARITEDQIRSKFADVVAHSLHIEPDRVTPEAFLDDLGAESLDLIEISMEVESQFNVWLPEKNILQTAIEVYGPGVIEKDGSLTDEGKALLRRRVLDEDAALFEGQVSVKDVQRYFLKVETWIRMIDGLLSFTPDSCRHCGAPLAASLGFRLKCVACGEEMTLRSGDEINREWVEQTLRAPVCVEAQTPEGIRPAVI